MTTAALGITRSILGQPWHWRRTSAEMGGESLAPDDLVTQLLMARGYLQPGWGSFVTRSDHLSLDSNYAAAVRRTTLDARRRGDVRFNSTKVAVDFQNAAHAHLAALLLDFDELVILDAADSIHNHERADDLADR